MPTAFVIAVAIGKEQGAHAELTPRDGNANRKFMRNSAGIRAIVQEDAGGMLA